jgi:hypothetical protein
MTSNAIVYSTTFWKTIGSHHQQGAEDVERDLADVEQVHQHRGAEADLRPVPGHRADLLRPAASAPFVDVDDGKFGLAESHTLRLERVLVAVGYLAGGR